EKAANARYIDSWYLDPYVRRKTDRLAGADKGTQTLLSLLYQNALRGRLPLPHFQDVEFRCFSQNGEDGILHYIFSLIGFTNRRVAEICCGTGLECNATNLIVNHGCVGLLFEGSEENVDCARRFFGRCQDTFSAPPTIVQAWITVEKINNLLREHGFTGDIDLL